MTSCGPKIAPHKVSKSSIIQCCIYPGQWFDQWICVRKKNKYSTKYWVPQFMIDVFVPEVEISPQVRKYIQTENRILMLNRAWKGVRTCIVTENPLAFPFAFSHHEKVQVGVIIPIQRVYQMYPIRGIQLMSSYCKKKLKENRIVKAKESIFYFFEKSAEWNNMQSVGRCFSPTTIAWFRILSIAFFVVFSWTSQFFILR